MTLSLDELAMDKLAIGSLCQRTCTRTWTRELLADYQHFTDVIPG
jgi:hypothetical protein